MWRQKQSGPEPWALAAGAAAGAGALAFALFRGVRMLRRRGRHAVAVPLRDDLDILEAAAVEALRRDADTGGCAIDVAAVGPGIIELTGLVPTPDAARRAARLVHSVPGIRTVISRLEIGTHEEQLADVRHRRSRGDAQFRERQWYGMNVGTGRRRQSAGTEPARDDDSTARRTRQLDVQRSDLDDAAPDATGPGVGHRPHLL